MADDQDFRDLRAADSVHDNPDALALVAEYEKQGRSAGSAALALFDRAIIATSDHALRAAWGNYPDLQPEFLTFESFSAYRRYMARGAARGSRGVAR